MNRLQILLANPHTTGAAIVYLAAKYGGRIAMIWWPQHHEKIAATADVLEGLAVAWGLAMAGDAKPPVDKTTQPPHA